LPIAANSYHPFGKVTFVHHSCADTSKQEIDQIVLPKVKMFSSSIDLPID
jgi:hypothetical protein